MKKKTKILIAIIGVLIVSALIIFGINELSKYKTYSAKITQIEGKRIIIRDSDNIEYQLYTNDIKINNTDGKIIDVLNLNIGDNIKIIIKDEIKRDIAMTPKLLQNVKLIKVLEKNLDNVKQDTTKNENNSDNESYEKYSNTIDNITLELNIPNDWKYKEEPIDNNIYKYALKLYKNSEEQYAMLYFYNNQFGVCGTERTSKNITLNNGKEAIVGYYEDSKKWNDISFYSMNRNIAVINYKLINTEADELIEFIKTINITENNL